MTKSFVVRNERCNLLNEAGLSILYLSDLCFSKSAKPLTNEILGLVNLHKPSVLLLGRPTVIGSEGLSIYSYFLKRLADGNHKVVALKDRSHLVWSRSRIEEMINQSGAICIDGKTIRIEFPNGWTLQVDGDFENQWAAETKVIRILNSYKPRNIRKLNQYYDLIFANHAFPRIILWEKDNQVYPGRFFCRWNGLRYFDEGCQMFVSRGVSSAFPFLLNSTSEILLCS